MKTGALQIPHMRVVMEFVVVNFENVCSKPVRRVASQKRRACVTRGIYPSGCFSAVVAALPPVVTQTQWFWSQRWYVFRMTYRRHRLFC